MMEVDLLEQHTDYVLVEENCTNELLTPLKRSGRLKYNCISVTNKLVAIGSNTGGIYIFSRNEQKLLQIAFAEKETGSVSIVKISPHEKFVAFISSNNVHVLDLRLDSRSKAETLKSSNTHIGSSVTCLHWDNASTKLYVGDDLGNVSMMSVSSSKAKNLFSLPLEVIMKLDSMIVQIDNVEDKILVSTFTKCYLCHTSKQQYSQIGQKLREGYYGACFLQQSTSAPMIYCARPGSRIWEVDFEGTVLNTHQFKQLLGIPARKVVKLEDNTDVWVVSAQNGPAQSVAFPKLVVLRNRYILTWTNEKLYVLDPINVRVILWTNQFTDIQDVCCVDCNIYVFFKSMKIVCVTFLPIVALIPQYIKVNSLESAANVCLSYKHIFDLKQVRTIFGLSDMSKLHDKLVASELIDLADKIKEVVDVLEEKIAAEDILEKSDTHCSEKSAIIDEQGNIVTESTSVFKQVDKDRGDDTNLDGCELIVRNSDVNSLVNKKVDSNVDSEINSLVKSEVNDDHIEHMITNDKKGESNLIFENGIKIESNTQETSITEDKVTIEINATKDKELNTNDDSNNSLGASDVNGVNNNYNSVQMSEKLDNENVTLNNSEVNQFDISTNIEQTHKDLENDQSVVQINQEMTGSPVPRLLVPESIPRTVSPVTMATNDSLMLEDEDDVGYLPIKGTIVRRLSSTSLSSLSSAEVFMDTSYSYENESSDPIAMPVRRKSGKKKMRRKSAVEMSASGNGPIKRSSSTSSRKSKSSSKDGTMSPQGSIQSYKEEDSISIYSNDSITMEDGGLVAMVTQESKDDDTIDGLSYNTKSSEVITGSPVSFTEEYSQSGEFTKSADFLKSGEYSPGEATLTRSMEIGKQGTTILSSSAPKTALMQFKNKMQNKVSTKTKVIIKNIKEKNLLTKAKEIAGNLSQGSEAYFNSGEVPFSDNPGFPVHPQTDSENNAKTSNLQPVDTSENTPKVSIDLTDFHVCTRDTVIRLQDIDILCDADRVKEILYGWIAVFNSTMKSYLIERYTDTRQESGRVDTNVKTSSKDSKLNDNENVRITVKFEEGNIESELDNNVTAVTEKKSISEILEEIKNILNAPSFCFIKDPFCIPQEWLCDVCDLAQACFDICCHGNLLNSLNTVENETDHCDKSTISSKNCDNNNSDGSVDCSKVNDDELMQDAKEKTFELDSLTNNQDTVCKTDNSCDIDDTLTKNNTESHIDNTLPTSESLLSEDDSIRKTDSDPVSGDELQANQNLNRDDCDDKCTVSNKNCFGNSNLPANQIDKKDKDSKNSNIDDVNNISKSKDDSVSELAVSSVDSKTDGDKSMNLDNIGETMDYNMGLFVRCLFPYLNVSRIREQTKSSNSSFYLWSALTTCMEAKSNYDAEKFGVEEKSMISYLIENQAEIDDGATLLGHISKMFRNNHDSIVDVCVRCHPYIQPLDVLYLCKYHMVTMETVYKQYMYCMIDMRSTDSRKQVLMELSDQPETALQWLDMLLSEDDYATKVRDNDGCPRCMSHRLRWKNARIINEYIDIVKKKDVRTQYLELCRKHGYWIGVLNILKIPGCRQEHVQCVLHLGDIMLLSDHSALGYLPSCITEWEEMLTMFVHLSCTARYQATEIDASDLSDLITWDNIGILLVKYIGPDAAVSLLGKYNDHTLSTQFYQICLLSGMVHKQQRLILHSMLEKIDTYLWSQRATALNPQLQYLAVTEKKISTQDAHDQSDVLPNMVGHLQKQKSDLYVEDPDCHWGIQNTIKMLCKCCSLPLRDIVSHDEPGVLVFKCGHSFHKFCLPGKECPFCR
ncbi:Hermansky-Pudlak syndrome 5 [Mactra antiquata]